jgi:hypothetical protein
VVSQAGGVLLVETIRKPGLDQAISAALTPWRKPRTVHDPGKVVLDVALAVALGGDCLADVGMLRAEPAVFGPVASDPTVSRLIGTLAASGKRALTALRRARAGVREHIWGLAGDAAPDAAGQVIVDLDGVLVLAHSEKQDAAATWKKTFGHQPLMGFVHHGRGGSGEPVVGLLRPGNAGSNTAADHIEAARLALKQLPKKYRRGRQTLIRTDSGGGTHEFVDWLSARGRWLPYSVGMIITDAMHAAVLKAPASAWTPAVEPDSEIRDGAWVAELDGDCLKGWPTGMRLIGRKERPHPRSPVALHRRRRHAPDLLRHQHQEHSDRRAGAAAPPVGPRRGPYPRCPRHRPAQPPAPRRSAEPDLAGERPDSPRPAGLDADARPHRPGPPVGASPATAAAVLRGRSACHYRTPPHPPLRQALALGRRDH